MLNFLNSLLDFIYLKKCYICHSSKFNKVLCDECYDKLTLVEPKKYLRDFEFYTCSIYENDIKKLIRGLKYHNNKELSIPLANIMFEQWKRLNLSTYKNLVFVPVPQYKKHKRKYNHVELLTKEFSQLVNIDYNFKLIERVKKTKPQYNLTIKERTKNLEGAFKLLKETNPETTYVIIDDIITTGSTIKEMIKTIKTKNYIIFSLSSTKMFMDN